MKGMSLTKSLEMNYRQQIKLIIQVNWLTILTLVR